MSATPKLEGVMRRFSFPRAGNPGDAAQSLEAIILDGRLEADQTWIKAQSGLDDAARDAACTAPVRNGHTPAGSSTVLSLVRASEGNDDELVGINILIEADRLLAICFGAASLVESGLSRSVGQQGVVSASRLLAIIVNALVRPLESEIARIVESIDQLEDKAMAETDDGLYDPVVLVARHVLILRRYLVPMREELSFLAMNIDELPGHSEPRYVRRAAEHPGRLISALDSAMQRVTLILDQLRKRDDIRMARAIYKLTIVGTVFLPLTFVTGLLGINVAGVPGAHDPIAFWLVCGFLIAVAVTSILVIRWRKWL